MDMTQLTSIASTTRTGDDDPTTDPDGAPTENPSGSTGGYGPRG